jgi:hypothetical protein
MFHILSGVPTMMKWVIALFAVLVQLSCASALKKQCQTTNWFQHGQAVAMSGRRLDADDLASRCESEGVHASAADLDLGFKSGMQNYCKPEIVYATGRDGQFFTDDFCDPNQMRLLKQKHTEGVKEFCQAENGYSVGAAGKVYNKICPGAMEKAWLPRYKKGRKVYLGNEVLSRERQINDLETDISQYERQRLEKSHELSMLSANSKRQQFVTKINPDGSKTTELQTIEDPNIQTQLNNVRWDMNSIERRIETSRSEQKKLRDQMFELKKEQSSLEE